MQLEPMCAGDRASAVAFIEAKLAKLVELDYATGANDVLELAQLGRQHGVAVLYRTQDAILVESLRALRRGLAADKATWRTRFLLYQFELMSIPADDVKLLWARADELVDVIVPADAVGAVYSQWKH